jgi:acetylornithine deacetylase
MKGPLAACVVAALGVGERVPATLLITTDEETTKAGARAVAGSGLARRLGLRGILVAEPTGLVPVRGHRASVNITATATGLQAHSSTGKGRNANWDLIPFLSEMRELARRLRDDPAFSDAAYDPPFPDFNLVIDNHGTAVNVAVPRATCRIKFRRSRGLRPEPVLEAVRAAADRAGVSLDLAAEGEPPELAENHPLVRLCAELSGKAPGTVPFGTDAVELQALAPCVVLGPGDIGLAHTPEERVPVADLAAAVPLMRRFLERGAAA